MALKSRATNAHNAAPAIAGAADAAVLATVYNKKIKEERIAFEIVKQDSFKKF